MKRTMMVGPKKFVGKTNNPQIHVHSNNKKTFTDFDTFSLMQVSSAAQTQAHSKAGIGLGPRSFMSGSSATRRRDVDQETKNNFSDATESH
mmetsp:Transcript_18455/g.23001  ORF Transcript_18455/g.23001 Transcript_18455/m.23001 type:complete len:91 (-) Transcript_18455:126-398(-)